MNMKLLQEIRDLLRTNENYEDERFADIWERDAEEQDGESGQNRHRTRDGGAVNVQATARLQMVICHFKTIDQAASAVEAIARGKSVILNMEEATPADARRIIDFLSGAAFASESILRKVSSGSYMILPKNIQLDESAVQMLRGWKDAESFQNGNGVI